MATWLVDHVNGVNRLDSHANGYLLRSVTGATQANPCQITTSVAHTFSTGDWVRPTSIGGMTTLNNNWYQITVTGANTFTLDGVDSTGFPAYTSGGSVVRHGITNTNPMRVCLPTGNYSVGQELEFSGYAGSTAINGNKYTITAILGTNTYEMGAVDSTLFGLNSNNAGSAKAVYRTISNVTNANPGVVTANGHGYTNGQLIWIPFGGGSMTQLAGKTYTVANATTNTFELSGVDTTAWGTFDAVAQSTWIRKEGSGTNSVYGDIVAGDEIWVAKCGTITQLTTANCTYTYGTDFISTSSSLSSDINVGDMVCRSATPDTTNFAYAVIARTGVQITLRTRHIESGTDTNSIYRIRAQAAGVNAQAIYQATTVPCHTVGGYTFANNTAPVKDSYTIVKHAVNFTVSTHHGFYSTVGATCENLFTADCYRGFWWTTQSGSAEDCHAVDNYIYGFDLSSNNCYMENCVAIGSRLASQNAILLSNTDGHTFVNSHAIAINSGTANAVFCNKVAADNDYSGLTGHVSFYGFQANTASQRIKNFAAKGCTNSMILGSGANNFVVENLTIENGVTSGLVIGTQVNSGRIKGLSYTGSTFPTNGLNITQSNGIWVEDFDFASCTFSVLLDQYSGNIWFRDGTFGTPGTAAFNKNANSSTVFLQRCRIGAGQEWKALPIPTGTSYNEPDYTVLDSFNGITGKFYQNHHITRQEGPPPYLVFQFNAASNAAYVDYPVIAQYVKRGDSFAIDFEISNLGSTAFSGTIYTVIRLNGKEITSGITGNGNITSLSSFDTWDAKAITVSGGQIDADGELTICWRFEKNSSNVPIAVRINP